MKKKMLCLALLVGLLASGSMTAYATESAEGDSTGIGHTDGGGYVNYTAAGKLEDNFQSDKVMNDTISAMQPGDTVVIDVDLKNSNGALTHWYIKNEIAQSMREADDRGGAYTYKLTYKDPNGKTDVLYDSFVSSNNGRVGLKGVEGMLSNESDYFYLGEVASGKSGKIQLQVTLDGETLGNAYQEKIAMLNLSFAVEPQPQGATQYKTVTRQIVNDEVVYLTEDGVPLAGNGLVKTGDETDLFPYVLAACLSGVLLLIIVFFGVKDRKKEEEGGAMA